MGAAGWQIPQIPSIAVVGEQDRFRVGANRDERQYVQIAMGRRVDVEALVAVLEKRLGDARITPPGGGEFKP